jgi:hypothetical protein
VSLDEELSAILARLELPAASREILLERFEQTLELARYGEGRIGLENLCENLYEFEVPLTRDARDGLAALCERCRVDAKSTDLLAALVVP